MIDRIDALSCFEAKLEKEEYMTTLLWVERRQLSCCCCCPSKKAPAEYLCENKRRERPESPTCPLASVDLQDEHLVRPVDVGGDGSHVRPIGASRGSSFLAEAADCLNAQRLGIAKGKESSCRERVRAMLSTHYWFHDERPN